MTRREELELEVRHIQYKRSNLEDKWDKCSGEIKRLEIIKEEIEEGLNINEQVLFEILEELEELNG